MDSSSSFLTSHEKDVDLSDDSAELVAKEEESEPNDDKKKAEHTRAPTTTTLVKKVSSRLDAFLSSYVQFTSNALNQDRGLKLLQWTLWLASRLVKYRNKNRNTPASDGLYKLSIDMSFVRYALRLFGFPASLEAARSGSWGSSDDASSNTSNSKKLMDWLGQFMAWSMMTYYPLEHVAYVKWMLPKSTAAPQPLQGGRGAIASAEKLSAWSCRAWVMYIVAEMAQCGVKLKELHQQRNQLLLEEENTRRDNNSEEKSGESSPSSSAALQELNQSIRQQQLQMVRSMLFTLPAIHWSLPKWDTDPWLKESVVNGLMWAEAVVSMYQSIWAFRKNNK